MPIRERFFNLTMAALLAAGLVSWPTAAAAAGPSGPGPEKPSRLGRAAAFQMDSAEAKSSPLSLRLYGGFSRAEAADLDAGLDGYFEIFELYRAWGYGTTTGGYESPFRAGYDAGADLIFQISRGIGISVGAGYLYFSKSSLMTYSLGTENIKISAAPKLTAVPIRLGLFLTLPLGNRLNLTVNGGAEAYAALKLDTVYRLDWSDGDWGERSLSARGGAPFDRVGFYGSLGFELMLSRNTGLFIEALGRYARLKNFEEAGESNKDSDGAETVEGRLYLASFTTDDGQTWDIFTVEETPPVSGTPSIVYSEPKVDLSGFSLRAGLRIRL